MRKWTIRRRWCDAHATWEWAAYPPDPDVMVGRLTTWVDAMLYAQAVEMRLRVKFARSGHYGIR